MSEQTYNPKDFPKVLYAYHSLSSPGTWLYETFIEDVGKGTLIGTYELKEVGKIEIKAEYERVNQQVELEQSDEKS